MFTVTEARANIYTVVMGFHGTNGLETSYMCTNQSLTLCAIQKYSSLGIYASILHTEFGSWSMTTTHGCMTFYGVYWTSVYPRKFCVS